MISTLFNIYVCYEEEFEDTKGVIIIAISKNRQHNGQKKKKQVIVMDRSPSMLKYNVRPPTGFNLAKML
jgi:hypothetical protein